MKVVITILLILLASCHTVDEKDILKLIAPVSLKNCNLKRFGSAYDGGYLLCAQELSKVESVYSYGIEGRDEFGCEVAKFTNSIVHQYDPFDTRAPQCYGAIAQFSPIGIAGKKTTDNNNRKFDTFASHVNSNNDIGKKLLLKMDVEGAEWESLLNTPDSLLKNCQQIVVELHELYTNNKLVIPVLNKLAKYFHVAHLHANNCCCTSNNISSSVVEVTYVNKDIFYIDESQTLPMTLPHQFDQKNVITKEDCPFNMNIFTKI